MAGYNMSFQINTKALLPSAVGFADWLIAQFVHKDRKILSHIAA